jgi:hypothetical protein
LAAFGSVELDSVMKALFVTRRSLWARFAIGVATTTRVTLAPLSRLATVQKAETFPHVDETRFSWSGIGSPKTISVATSGPRFATVIV